MNQFLQIPLKLLTTKDPIQILTYAIIDNQKTTNPFDEVVNLPVSYIAFETMHNKYNIRKATAIDAVHELKDNGFLDYKQLPTERTNELYNQYSFPAFKPIYSKDGRVIGSAIKEPYKEIDSAVLTTDLSSKEKGVLLMLHLLSIDTSEIVYEEKEIAEKLGITKRTLDKYIKLFLKKNLLFKGKHLYALKDIYSTKPLTIIL